MEQDPKRMKTDDPQQELAELRKEIDAVDRTLVDLLNKRARISVSIGSAKKNLNPAADPQVYVPSREKEIFEKVVKLNQGPLTDDAVRAIYREVMSASISLQKGLSVAYLGPPGTYSHQAATNRFGDSAEYLPMPTIPDVISAVEKGQAIYGVVPFENSTFGTVVQTIDRLITTNLKIYAESYLEIRHHLLSNSQKSMIRRIYSHPEAFGQSKRWLENNMPGVELVNVSSTANAAKMASKEPHCAAICSEVCAELYDLLIVDRDVQDDNLNTTRFFVVGTENGSPTKEDKTLIMFSVDHRQPGALCDALSVFKKEIINLTKIDSRPIPSRRWQYYFFLEFEGHHKNQNVADALSALASFCIDIKILGSYPISR